MLQAQNYIWHTYFANVNLIKASLSPCPLWEKIIRSSQRDSDVTKKTKQKTPQKQKKRLMKPKTLAWLRKTELQVIFSPVLAEMRRGYTCVGCSKLILPFRRFYLPLEYNNGKYPSYEPMHLVITPTFSSILRFWSSFKAPRLRGRETIQI